LLIAKDFLDVKEGPGDHAEIKSRQNRNNDDDTQKLSQRESQVSWFHGLYLLNHLTNAAAKSFELFLPTAKAPAAF
jgi:hypothetical protein